MDSWKRTIYNYICEQLYLLLFTARPVRFRESLKDVEVPEGRAATLRCVLSSVAAPVEWRHGDDVVKSSSKYSLRQEGAVLELVIRDLKPQDSGQYSCSFGDQTTAATLTVKSKCAWSVLCSGPSGKLTSVQGSNEVFCLCTCCSRDCPVHRKIEEQGGHRRDHGHTAV